jgi:CRP-like cAMP-binding protein
MSILDKHKIDFRILDRPDVPVRKVKAGDTIVARGTPATEMYLMRKGHAEITIGDKVVEEVEAGGIFGEMALIDHAPRSASVIAKEDSEVIPIDERLFVILVQDAPFFALDVMRVLVGRIRAMNRTVS